MAAKTTTSAAPAEAGAPADQSTSDEPAFGTTSGRPDHHHGDSQQGKSGVV